MITVERCNFTCTIFLVRFFMPVLFGVYCTLHTGPKKTHTPKIEQLQQKDILNWKVKISVAVIDGAGNEKTNSRS